MPRTTPLVLTDRGEPYMSFRRAALFNARFEAARVVSTSDPLPPRAAPQSEGVR